MINFSEALKYAKDYYAKKNLTNIIEAYDSENCWIIFGGKKGLTLIGSAGISIDKETGAINDFILPSKNETFQWKCLSSIL